jgi:hypothetical protein
MHSAKSAFLMLTHWCYVAVLCCCLVLRCCLYRRHVTGRWNALHPCKVGCSILLSVILLIPRRIPGRMHTTIDVTGSRMAHPTFIDIPESRMSHPTFIDIVGVALHPSPNAYDCCVHIDCWPTSEHTDCCIRCLLHTLTDVCIQRRSESDTLLRPENMSYVSTKSKTYNYDHTQRVALASLKYLSVQYGKQTEHWYPQVHCQPGRLSVCTGYVGQNNSFTTCTFLQNIEGYKFAEFLVTQLCPFVSSGCSRHVICIRQTSICFASVFYWFC